MFNAIYIYVNGAFHEFVHLGHVDEGPGEDEADLLSIACGIDVEDIKAIKGMWGRKVNERPESLEQALKEVTCKECRKAVMGGVKP